MTGPMVPETDVHDAARRAADGSALLLDVREPDEWTHLRSAHSTLVPLGALDPQTVPRDRPVLVICRSGRRSALAALDLIASGHDAANVTGGILAWVAAGLPTESA
jgi:rhodanese-related sulfurtransferase